MTTTPQDTLPSKLHILSAYTACDISDALLRLNVPNAGFLPDLVPFPSGQHAAATFQRPIIAPASTVLFISTSISTSTAPDTWASPPTFPSTSPDPSASPTSPSAAAFPASNIPPHTPYADLIPPNTITILRQPDRQICAVLGGLIAQRLAVRGVAGAVVLGRARDAAEVGRSGLLVWSWGRSTVGAGLEARAWAVGGRVQWGGCGVEAGDIVFADPREGVVVIPRAMLDETIELLPRLTSADERVMEDVKGGATLKEAFARHRGNI